MTGNSVNNVLGRQLALAVRIGGNLHALPIDMVEEVLPALPIETIPQCPAFVRGVVFVRGHLIPVLDAAERLRLRDHVRPAEPHIVCLRIGSRLVGLEVDEAIDLIEIPSSTALP
ncbi:MAG: chemotaxis protein CheW, partial [Planctomycetaceae bacterium]|nr:chemotaxis protein CheW [Planctomycetaceae bacterium]